jgi:hypothetical protein
MLEKETISAFAASIARAGIGVAEEPDASRRYVAWRLIPKGDAAT